MPIHNADIARLFEEMADLLVIGDANLFRVRAYRNAARLVGEVQLDIAAAPAKGEALPKLPGIGADLDGKIREIVATGHLAALDRLRQTIKQASEPKRDAARCGVVRLVGGAPASDGLPPGGEP